MDTMEETTFYDLCKCCQKEGYMKNMWKEYYCDDRIEIYGQMILDTFGLSWESSDGVSKENICDKCIKKLRLAARFRDMLKTFEGADDNQAENEDMNPEYLEYNNVSEEDTQWNGDAVEQNVELEIEYLEEDAEAVEKSIKTTKKKKKPVQSKRNNMTDVYVKSKKIKTDLPYIQEDNIRRITKENNEAFVKEIQYLLSVTTSMPFKVRTSRLYCAYCFLNGPWFEDPDDLRNHTQVIHKKEIVTAISDSLKPYRVNEMLRMDISTLKCKLCYENLISWNNMFQHFNDEHDLSFDQAYTRVIPFILDGKYNCALCMQEFANFQYLDRHMNAHYDNYICSECGHSFISRSRLNKHIMRHEKGKYECEYCGKTFQQKGYRTKHVLIKHKNVKFFKCKYCHESFSSDYFKHLHIVEKHKDKIQAITCEICGKVFSLYTYYIAHKKTHNKVKRFQCVYCSKWFLSKQELKMHVYRHNGLGDYQSVVCYRRFVVRKELNDHIHRAHSDNKYESGTSPPLSPV